MKKLFFIEIPVIICVFYTVLNIFNSILLLTNGINVVTTSNNFMMLLWCAIGTLAVYSQKMFPNKSPLAVLIFAYLVSSALILLTIYITGLYEDLHPDAYKDAFRSFSIPYIIGSIVYYIALYMDAMKQNEWIQEIRATDSDT